jgi:hypothetical protein
MMNKEYPKRVKGWCTKAQSIYWLNADEQKFARDKLKQENK